MKYNFDEIIDRRHTNALNTDGFRGYIFHDFEGKKIFPFKDEEFVRMWIADMEFAMCPHIIDAIKERLDKRIIGYSQVFEQSFYDAYNEWSEKMYGWTYPRKDFCFSLGIIPALFKLTEFLLTDNEYAIVNTPAYGYFQHALNYNGKKHFIISSSAMKKAVGKLILQRSNGTRPTLWRSFSFGATRTTRRAVSGRKKN